MNAHDVYRLLGWLLEDTIICTWARGDGGGAGPGGRGGDYRVRKAQELNEQQKYKQTSHKRTREAWQS